MDPISSSALSRIVFSVNASQAKSNTVGVSSAVDDAISNDTTTDAVVPDYLQQLLRKTQRTMQSASALPLGVDYSIASVTPGNAEKAKMTTERLAELLFKTVKLFCSAELEKGPNCVRSPASLVQNYEKFADCIDAMLMKVDRALRICDEQSPTTTIAHGLASRPQEAMGMHAPQEALPEVSTKPLDDVCRPLLPHLIGNDASCMSLPSRKKVWSEAFNGTPNVGRFVPILAYKPCGRYPLALEVKEAQKQLEAAKSRIANGLPPVDVVQQDALPHLYEEEIRALNWGDSGSPEGLLKLFTPVQPEEPPTLSTTPLVWVRTKDELLAMIEELKNQAQIAIDVEHHGVHSFRGVTCLIQLSTRKKDYLIDPLALVDDLWQLNYITANPEILKVLHGADHDVVWLQRDFSVYIVNLFDTSQAARVLNIPGGNSLANLLVYYCRVTADKKFQLADWRVRPLPDAMVSYARSDTHYLLYIHDRLRNDLLSNGNEEIPGNLMHTVLERSRDVSLRCYQNVTVSPEKSAAMLLERHPAPFGPTAFSRLVALIAWRTATARQLDESPHSLLSNALIIRLASKGPKTWAELQLLAHPVPSSVQQYAEELLRIIATTKAEPTAAVPTAPIAVPVAEALCVNQAINVSSSTEKRSGEILASVEQNSDDDALQTDAVVHKTMTEKPMVTVSVASSYRQVTVSERSAPSCSFVDGFQFIFAAEDLRPEKRKRRLLATALVRQTSLAKRKHCVAVESQMASQEATTAAALTQSTHEHRSSSVTVPTLSRPEAVEHKTISVEILQNSKEKKHSGGTGKKRKRGCIAPHLLADLDQKTATSVKSKQHANTVAKNSNVKMSKNAAKNDPEKSKKCSSSQNLSVLKQQQNLTLKGASSATLDFLPATLLASCPAQKKPDLPAMPQLFGNSAATSATVSRAKKRRKSKW